MSGVGGGGGKAEERRKKGVELAPGVAAAAATREDDGRCRFPDLLLLLLPTVVERTNAKSDSTARCVSQSRGCVIASLRHCVGASTKPAPETRNAAYENFGEKKIHFLHSDGGKMELDNWIDLTLTVLIQFFPAKS